LYLFILESERQECVKLDFISPLKDPLKSANIQDKIESCRALGNMCYENGLKIFFKHFLLLYLVFFIADGCDLVFNTIGINTLFDVCRYACETHEKEGAQLRMMILGTLHNIINSNGNKKKS